MPHDRGRERDRRVAERRGGGVVHPLLGRRPAQARRRLGRRDGAVPDRLARRQGRCVDQAEAGVRA